jgi:hypothetical protein
MYMKFSTLRTYEKAFCCFYALKKIVEELMINGCIILINLNRKPFNFFAFFIRMTE